MYVPLESNRTLNAYLKQKHGLTNVQWNRDAQDGAGAPPAESIAMYQQIKKGDNILALNHETHESTAKQVRECEPARARVHNQARIRSTSDAILAPLHSTCPPQALPKDRRQVHGRWQVHEDAAAQVQGHGQARQARRQVSRPRQSCPSP